MLQILESISPVFLVIGLGHLAGRWGFLPETFIHSANRLVYFVAIPILVFGEIARGNFSDSFDIRQIGGTFLAAAVILVLSLVTARVLKVSPGGTATFSQICFHGNLGYVGLAVIFYALGPEGRGAASVLAGFLILFQNVAAISLFTFVASHRDRLDREALVKFLGNPIILATLLGLIFSALRITLPEFLTGAFDIVGDMALPLALLIIGGSLKAASARRLQLVSMAAVFKLLLLPLAGMVFFKFLEVGPAATTTGIILMASPSATISYVMASEMGGKPDLAAAAVTISTIASIVTYTFWISVTGGG